MLLTCRNYYAGISIHVTAFDEVFIDGLTSSITPVYSKMVDRELETLHLRISKISGKPNSGRLAYRQHI